MYSLYPLTRAKEFSTLNGMIQEKLKQIETELHQLAPQSFGPSPYDLPPFLTWLAQDYLPSQKTQISQSRVYHSQQNILKMAKAVLGSQSEAQGLLRGLQELTQAIDSENSQVRPGWKGDANLDGLALLIEAENELRAIGYWVENPEQSPIELMEAPYQPPDQALQFFYLPRERQRIQKQSLDPQILYSLADLRSELLGIPKTQRLLEILKQYAQWISRNTKEAPVVDLDFQRQDAEVWQAQYSAAAIEKAFTRKYESLRSQVKAPGFKRGEAPLSEIRKHAGERAAYDILRDLIFTRIANPFGPQLSGTSVICTLEPLMENRSLGFFLVGRSDPGFLAESVEGLTVEKIS